MHPHLTVEKNWQEARKAKLKQYEDQVVMTVPSLPPTGQNKCLFYRFFSENCMSYIKPMPLLMESRCTWRDWHPDAPVHPHIPLHFLFLQRTNSPSELWIDTKDFIHIVIMVTGDRLTKSQKPSRQVKKQKSRISHEANDAPTTQNTNWLKLWTKHLQPTFKQHRWVWQTCN